MLYADINISQGTSSLYICKEQSNIDYYNNKYRRAKASLAE